MKTLETITIMGTMPDDWGIVPFTVREEVRDMILPTQCSECRGNGVIYNPLRKVIDGSLRASGSVFAMLEKQVREDYPHLSDYQVRDAFFKGEYHTEGDDSSKWYRSEPLMTVYGWVNHVERGSQRFPCPCCPTKQGRSRYGGPRAGTGIIHEKFENVPVNAHYPSWPEGTEFTSRFPRGHGGCEACGKTHIKTGEFPVAAQRQDGTWVGMFVGNSCLQKFGFKRFKSVDQQATKWDLRKAHDDKTKWVSKSLKGESGSTQPMAKRVIDIYLRSRKNLGADLDDVSAPAEVVEEVVEVEQEVKTVKPIEVKDISMKGKKGEGKTISLTPAKTFDCPHCGKSFKSRQGRYNHLKKSSCASHQS